MDTIGESTLTHLFTSGVASLTTANIGALTTANVSVLSGVDCRALSGQGAVLLVAKNTGGSGALTLAAKLAHAQDGDVVTSVTPGINTGNGTCTQVYGGPNSVAENITITFSNATTASVVGDVTGAIGTATVGTLFQSAQIEFMLTAGSVAWVNNDTIVIVTTARTYADVADVAFTTLTTANVAALTAVQMKPLNFDQVGRFLRPQVTLGGTAPEYEVAMTCMSQVK